MFVINYTPSVDDPQILAYGCLDGREHPFVLGASLFHLPLSFGVNRKECIELHSKLRNVVIAELLSYGGHTVEYSMLKSRIPNIGGFCGINIIFEESTCNQEFCIKIMINFCPTNTIICVNELVFKTSKPIHYDKPRIKSSDLIASFTIPAGVCECLCDCKVV
jgi:hypothetical protein